MSPEEGTQVEEQREELQAQVKHAERMARQHMHDLAILVSKFAQDIERQSKDENVLMGLYDTLTSVQAITGNSRLTSLARDIADLAVLSDRLAQLNAKEQ